MQRILHDLQTALAGIYAAPLPYDIHDFLITDAHLAATLTPERASRTNQERLLVQADEADPRMSLYIDDGILDALRADDPGVSLHAGNLAPFLIALEGVSHLHYALWNGEREMPVTPFELELQAEIDKYVACAKYFGLQREGEVPRRLHRVLFDAARFDDTLDEEERARYLDANHFAARYCLALQRRYPGLHREQGFLRELRAFYRLGRNDKVRRIRALH